MTTPEEAQKLPHGIIERLARSIAWLERGELLPGSSACIGLNDIKALHAMLTATPPVNQQLADLQSELTEQARLNGMGSERELALMAEVERLRSRLAKQEAGWRPIDEAPDDMTECVVVRWVDEDEQEHRDFDYMEDGCWVKWHDHAEHVEVIGGWGVSYTPPYTHYMPLPAAPTGDSK